MVLPNILSREWFIVKAVLLLISIPVHEWAHAWAAYRLGDDTAALQGRLTLYPLAHWDLFGTIALLVSPFGWGKPVPVSPYRLRGSMRRSWALVSIAGPLSNLVLATLAAIPFRMEWVSRYAASSSIANWADVLEQVIFINLSLMLFNLIPVPPLDGSRVLGWLLPRRWSHIIDLLERFSGIGLVLVLFALSATGILGCVLAPCMFLLLWALGVR